MKSIAQALKQPPFFLFHLFVTLFVWVFVWQHAFQLNLTYDESTSYHVLKIGNYRALPGIANTHWLNSFFIRLIMTFNESVVGLRLHSIFAFPFFAQGVYRLAKFIKSGGAQIAFYCLIVFNPYVLDFFSLARGYSLAMTFQVWTMLFFIKAIQSEFNYRLWLQVVLLSALTLGSNLSYQYTIITIAAGYLLNCIITGSPFSWYTHNQKRKITWLFVLLLFFTTVDLLFIKYYGKDLEFGGRENFLGSIFNTFWNNSLYKAGYSFVSIWLSWCTFALIITACIYFTQITIQQKTHTPGIIAAFLIGGILLLNVIFHLVFDATFIANRTALQWYVPGLFTIFLAIGEWRLPVKKNQFISYGVGVAAGMLIIVHFVTGNYGSRTMEYYLEDLNREALNDLYAQHPVHPGVPSHMAGVYINYYSLVNPPAPAAKTFKESLKYPLIDKSIKTLNESDYIISHAANTIRYLDSMHIPYTIVKTYKDSDFKIIKLQH